MPPVPTTTNASTDELTGYTGLTEIGRGGDSIVYRARQSSLNRDVAIKVLLVDDPETVARFEREIEITVELGRQHPNIMTVLDTGATESGRPAIVMDHYERGSLDQRLHENGPLPAAEAVAIGCVLADALQFAHDHGVLHRDVKPQNVMILPTSYVLGDFGIARVVDSEHTASAERFTVRHASPQILDGLPPTVQDDIWSLGSTLFTLIDGRTPFASSEPGDDTALAYLRRARTEPHRRPSVDAAYAGLVTVIDRALEKDPERRWPDIASMRTALEELRSSFLQAWSPEGSDSSGPGPTEPPGPNEPPEDAAQAEPGPVVTPQVLEPTPEADRPHADEPAPVALSALAHGSSTPEVDAEPTGVVPGAKAVKSSLREDSPVSDGAGQDEKEGRSKGRIVLALAAVALAIGVTLGALGGILRNDDATGSQSQPPSQSAGEIRSLDQMPVETGDSQPLQIDSSMKPVITKIDVQGTSVLLEWRDLSEGKAVRFAIAQTQPTSLILGEAAAQESSYTIDGIDPDATRVCFVVMAFGADQSVASSVPRCSGTS